MPRDRFALLLFLASVLAAPAAWAQTPPVANARVPGSDFTRPGGDVEPDTTSPWRYFPLHVGDAWEYYYYFGNGVRRRVDVLGEETHEGRHYFTWRSRTYDGNGNQVNSFGPVPVRFDTASAVVQFYITEIGEERRLPWTRCRFDAAFGSEVVCPHREKFPFEVGGGYDGLLAFGGAFPGTGEDTVRTAVKTYYSFLPGNTEDFRYAADLGFAYLENEIEAEGIYYARVDGVEYGQAFYPVAGETGPPAEQVALALSAFPNPFRDHLSVLVEGAEPGLAELEVVDVLGRVVLRRDLNAPGSGEHTVSLDASRLSAGVYLVRAQMVAPGGAVQALTQKLTLVK